MNKELYVSSTPHETKVALTEDDQLAEVFFERENEYTLAGSIYKGRVTRVLPGMQSAFVDIGLERDAFLYVSDFLELTGDEDEDEEFGEIPAPRGAIQFDKAQPMRPAQTTQTQEAPVEPEVEEDLETSAEEFSATEEPQENGEPAAADDREGGDGDGARRWRGRRRRRGGRRGRGFEAEERSESPSQSTEPAAEAPQPRPTPQPRATSQSRAEYTPPASYTPIILPGESISKYRNMAQPAAATPAEQLNSPDENATVPASQEEVEQEIAEEATHLDQGYSESTEQAEAASSANEQPASTETEEASVAAIEQPPPQRGRGRWGRSRRRGAEQRDSGGTPPAEKQEDAIAEVALSESAASPTAETAGEAQTSADFSNQSGSAEQTAQESSKHLKEQSSPAGPSGEESPTEQTASESETEHEVDTPAGSFELAAPEQHEAPSVAPAGRTLEHEVLEDEEAEFHPMPDDLSALREVAGDEELVLEEETIDASGKFSDRWVPQIEDVDEDEVVAAEMRGEKIYEAEEEEENGEEEEEEVAERGEIRASAPTAGYQQRSTPQRPTYERRGYRDNRRGGPRRNFRSRPNNNRNQPLITDLLKEGQEVLIQIAKEPIGKKGARITSHIALPGRFLVYMPTVNHVGVSRKISSDEERQRLKRIVTSERENGLGGFIVRTAAANIKEDDLRADIRFLKHLWAEIKNRAENSRSPALIYHDLNLVERVLRDQVNADFSQIWVDTEDEYERVVRFANRFQPSLVRRIKLYTKDTPLFEQFGIQDEINRSLKSKVWLKSGGHIVINQTEALVAIDVNTGKYVGKTQRLEDTIVKTNVDAIKEIVRQIRLRDLGGIIVIDFIDMDERRNRQKVMQALEEALRNDRAPSKVLQFNDFGLVAITRKRVKQSLERTLGEPCPYCTGAGFVKSVPTVCNELYIEMRKMTKAHDMDDITIRVHPEVAKALKADNGKLIGELEELTGKTVLVKSDPALHQEMFDIH
jgi:ribonuclease G